jgi:hypothetical protein
MSYIQKFLLLLCLCGIFLNFQKTSNDSTNPGASDGAKLAGKWYWVKSTISLRFDDGTTQNVNMNGERKEWIDLTHQKTQNNTSTGTLKKGGATGEASGDWTYTTNDKLLVIKYSELGENLHSYRRVDKLSDNAMTLTADDALIVREYTENGLLELGSKKLVGGSIIEQYER